MTSVTLDPRHPKDDVSLTRVRDKCVTHSNIMKRWCVNMTIVMERFASIIREVRNTFAVHFGRTKIYYINGPDTLPPPLTKAEEEVVFARLEQKDEAAKQELIVHNLRLVVYIARKFESSGVGMEDLISIGTIGLIKAVNTFCPARGIKLATYASRCIENEILMFMRKCQSHKNEVSIDEPLNIDWDGNELLLSDILGTDVDAINRPIEQDIEKNILLETVNRLGDRERQIMRLRFGLDGGEERTQKEVADIIGISQSYISRLEKRIVKRLKKELERIS